MKIFIYKLPNRGEKGELISSPEYNIILEEIEYYGNGFLIKSIKDCRKGFFVTNREINNKPFFIRHRHYCGSVHRPLYISLIHSFDIKEKDREKTIYWPFTGSVVLGLYPNKIKVYGRAIENNLSKLGIL